jgi:DNA invertase Pin-like site-specific DNA recombinase
MVVLATQGKLYGYLRVSTDKQAMSPLVQRGIIIAEAERLGRKISAWFQDAPIENPDGSINDSVSGKVFVGKRKAGSELMARLKKGDGVIVAKLDRIFRSASDCCQCLDRWERAGVDITICDMPGLDISQPMGKAMLQMIAVFAELERGMISQRTKEGLGLRKSRGTANGKYPGYGFQWEKRWDAKLLKHLKHKVPYPEERRVMKEIVKWRMDDHSWHTIEAHLADLGMVTKEGKRWEVSRIIRSYKAELILMAEENGHK